MGMLLRIPVWKYPRVIATYTTYSLGWTREHERLRRFYRFGSYITSKGDYSTKVDKRIGFLRWTLILLLFLNFIIAWYAWLQVILSLFGKMSLCHCASCFMSVFRVGTWVGWGGGSSRNNCRLKVRDVLMVFIVIDIFVDQSRSKSLQIKLSNECSDERENASRVCEESIFILPLWPPKYAHVFYCGSLWSFSLARAQDGSSNKYDWPEM